MSRKGINVALGAIVTSTMLAGVACSAGPDSTGVSSDQQTVNAQSVAPQAQGYDGETIFRGVFFGDGPVAKLLPEVWENPDIVQMRESAKHITPEVAADRLEASAEFARQSGDTASADHFTGQAKQLRSGEATVDDVLRVGDEQSAIQSVLTNIRSKDAAFFDHFAGEMQSGDHLRVEAALETGVGLLAQSTQTQLQTNPGHNCFYVVVGVAVAVGYVAVVAAGVGATVAAIYNYTYIVNTSHFWNGAATGGSQDLQRDVLIDDLTDRLHRN